MRVVVGQHDLSSVDSEEQVRIYELKALLFPNKCNNFNKLFFFSSKVFDIEEVVRHHNWEYACQKNTTEF